MRSFFLGLYISSRTPVISSSPPKSFFNRSMSSCVLNQEQRAAAVQPARIAGRTFLKSSFPCFQRKKDAMTADGRKNSKLTSLAWGCSMPSTRVSHKISRLPPPTPIPARNPNTVPTISVIASESTINTGYLPIRSVHPMPCAAIWWGSFCPIHLLPHRLRYCRQDREG